MSARPHRLAWLALVAIGAATAACSAILGLDAPPPQDTETMNGDAAASDDAGPASDAASDAASDTATTPPICTPLGALDDAGASYFPLDQVVINDAGSMTWDFFDTTTVNGLGNSNYAGGAFDGRYVYFAGRGNHVGRYDTSLGAAAFNDGAAWAGFVTTQIGAPGGFDGALFDGRYVYFVPFELGTAFGGVTARYDTTGAFNATTSWASFDMTTLAADGGAATKGFNGGAFDGRYVYFVPRYDGAPDGRVVRFDTSTSLDAGPASDAGDGGAGSGAFDDPALWSTFDVSTVNPAATGFVGAIFGGADLYFIPYLNDAFDASVHGGESSIVARYTTHTDFGTASSWATFDTTLVNGLTASNYGGAFDGQFVYLVPKNAGIVTRFDTSAHSFTSAAGWSTYDTTNVVQLDAGAAPLFAGGAFDGRFVYFVPTNTGFGTITRYDTLSTFTADCAWGAMDLTQITPPTASAENFAGAVFDGEFLYLVPDGDGIVARFHAKTPKSMPNLPEFHGSFL